MAPLQDGKKGQYFQLQCFLLQERKVALCQPIWGQRKWQWGLLDNLEHPFACCNLLPLV